MRMPWLLIVPALAMSCAEGTLDAVDPVLIDAGPGDDAPDADAPDASDAAPPVDVRPDAPADVAVVRDVAPALDRPAEVDVPSELTDDVQPAVDAGADAPTDVPTDVPTAPTDTGFGAGPTGYRVVRDDPAGPWVDACAQPGHQTVLVNVDDGEFRTTLPFRFRYWGRPLAEGSPVTISPNGYVTLQPGASTPANGIIPNHLDGVDAVLAAMWRDLNTRGPGVCLAVVGNAPARRWVIQWADARYFTSIFGHLNFEVVLNESGDAIDFNYASMTLPEPATVGLENWEGSSASIPFTIPQPIVFSNTRARFVPR